MARSMTKNILHSAGAVLAWALAFPALAQPSREPPVAAAPTTASAPPPAAVTVPEPPTSPSLDSILRGQGEGLSADDAARLAVASAPSIDRARESLRQVQAGADRAMYGFVPRLDVTASYARLPTRGGRLVSQDASDTIDALTDPAAGDLWDRHAQVLEDRYQLLGTLTFPVSDYFLEVWPRYESAAGIAEAQEYGVEAEASRVALAARESYYQYARARAGLAVARIAAEQAEQREHRISALSDVGHVGRADLLRVRAQLASARVAVARAEGGVEISATALRTLLHLEPGTEVGVAEDLFVDPEADLGSRPALIDRALAQRAEVRALRRLITARGRAVDAAEGSRYPNLLVSGQAEVGSPNSRLFLQERDPQVTGHVSVILQWSLHETLNGERLADEARASVGQARADLRTLEDAIRNQVAEALVTYRAARQALEAARLGVEAAEESSRVRRALFARGHGLVSELVDASAEEIRAQLDLTNAAIDARVALARLNRAIGD